MKRILATLVIASLAGASMAIAQDNPIEKRQKIMGTYGDAMKVVVPMVKGEKDFDAAAATEAMTKISTSIEEFVTLFPEGSETGGNTEALPIIWQEKADFESWAPKLKEDATKAAEAAAGGLDSFRTAFAEVGKDCGGCHEKFRVKKN